MGDLAGGRTLVQPALAALDVLEVLDGVGDVSFGAVDADFGQRTVEDLAGGADEGAALQVLLIAGLLADEGDGSADWAFAEDGARAAFDHRIGGGDKVVELLQRTWLLVGHHRGDGLGRVAVCGHGGLPLDHLPNARRGGPDQLRDGGGLGQVLPVFLRHVAAGDGEV